MNDDEYGGGKSGADEGDDGAGNVDDESMTVQYFVVGFAEVWKTTVYESSTAELPFSNLVDLEMKVLLWNFHNQTRQK